MSLSGILVKERDEILLFYTVKMILVSDIN
jgi:hypothetical protein